MKRGLEQVVGGSTKEELMIRQLMLSGLTSLVEGNAYARAKQAGTGRQNRRNQITESTSNF